MQRKLKNQGKELINMTVRISQEDREELDRLIEEVRGPNPLAEPPTRSGLASRMLQRELAERRKARPAK